MRLISLNRYISLFVLIIFFLPLQAEDQIDIWNKEKEKNTEIKRLNKNIPDQQINSNIISKTNINSNIQIENAILDNSQDKKIFGVYDPAENNFNLNMWSNTDSEKVRSSIKRINKINNYAKFF